MVELRMRYRAMSGYGRNHHEKLGLEEILCSSQVAISDTAAMSPDLSCNYTDMRSSQPN
jgi:hypothetical protein